LHEPYNSAVQGYCAACDNNIKQEAPLVVCLLDKVPPHPGVRSGSL